MSLNEFHCKSQILNRTHFLFIKYYGAKYTSIPFRHLPEPRLPVSVPAAPARPEAPLALRSSPCAAAFQRSGQRSLPEQNGWNSAGTAETGEKTRWETSHVLHTVYERRSRRCSCSYPNKAITRREDAQTEGQQDPATEVAVAIVVVLKLLADLTVNFIPGQTTYMNIV